MEIRILSSLEDIEATIEVQRQAWGSDELHIVPSHIMRGICDNGGFMLGAFEEGRMIGFVISIPTAEPGVYLSHMMGILPNHQHKNVGFGILKQMLTVARERGISKFVWTFDPLESANANLYIRKMGAVCRRYVEDYYIFGASKLNVGVPADRFKMELFVDEDVRATRFSARAEAMRVEIPGNFQELKGRSLAEACSWRERTRALFREYINEQGYWVVGFEYHPDKQEGVFVLKKAG